jgi:hypothetical protein
MPGMFARAGLTLCFAFCGLALAQQPQSWTSRDQLALTYYFYWYDVHTGQHFGDAPITGLTLHPPDSYLSTYSKTDVLFQQRELSDMAAAGIDAAPQNAGSSSAAAAESGGCRSAEHRLRWC